MAMVDLFLPAWTVENYLGDDLFRLARSISFPLLECGNSVLYLLQNAFSIEANAFYAC